MSDKPTADFIDAYQKENPDLDFTEYEAETDLGQEEVEGAHQERPQDAPGGAEGDSA